MKRKFVKVVFIVIIFTMVPLSMIGCGGGSSSSGSTNSSDDYSNYTPSQADLDLLNEVSHKTFNYFWDKANSTTGLVLDKTADPNVASISATGFGLAALAVGAENGYITRQAGYDRALLTLKTFANGVVEGKNGFFMHWVNAATGKETSYGNEVSSIDTALFIAGAIFAGQYFGDEVKTLADQLYQNIDWKWMSNGSTTLTMGWKSDTGFLSSRWGNNFDEGLLATLLAMGSPTHPIDQVAWNAINRSVRHMYNGESYIAYSEESLFIYQFPLIYFDMRNTRDNYTNYFNNATLASKYNRAYTKNSSLYQKYGDVWGLSAEDMPVAGYKAYGAQDGINDGTIAPYASISSLPFTPGASMASLRAMKQNFSNVYDTYGFHAGFNITTKTPWYSSNYIGIDQGDILLMIANYRSGLVWKYFMKNTYMQNAMKLAGFDKYK